MRRCPEHMTIMTYFMLGICMLVCWWCFSGLEFVTPICIGFCMVLSLVEILFSPKILCFSFPPLQIVFNFSLVWSVEGTQVWFCFLVAVCSVLCASFLVG